MWFYAIAATVLAGPRGKRDLANDDFEKLLCEILPDVILYMRPDYVPGKEYNMELPRLAREAIQADKKRALAQ